MFYQSQRYGPQHVSDRVRDDLKLWLQFFQQSSQIRTSINLITYTQRTIQIVTGASEAGLGGFNTETGMAWRWRLPSWLLGKAHINFLEFLASHIGLWSELIHCKGRPHRFLCLTDSSSALGWLYKSNFNPTSHSGHDAIVRKFATLLLESEHALYSQHIRGKDNVVADSLSRDHDIPPAQLTFLLNHLYKSQLKVPSQLSEALPPEVTCFLNSLEPLFIKRKASPLPHAPSSLGDLFAGRTGWHDVISTTNSLMNLTRTNASCSCPLSRLVFETIKETQENNISCMELQSEPPFPTYARPFGRTHGGIRF